jgi:hypothetical protein
MPVLASLPAWPYNRANFAKRHMTRKPTPAPLPSSARATRGFKPAAGLLAPQIRHVGEQRGFAIAKLLTHWEEIVGPEMAAQTRPVKVGYGREGMGGTLTLLVMGAAAPLVEMQKEKLRAAVNAVYGYSAIARIILTQTASMGFAEGQALFSHATPSAPPAAPPPEIVAQAAAEAAPIQDQDLRRALATLAQNVHLKNQTKKG